MTVLDTLAYPVRGETPLRTLVTGALLSALGPLVVPAILVAGYYGRVLAGSAGGDRRPPPFGRWRALFSQGLKTWIVVAGYVVTAVLLVLLLGFAAFLLGELLPSAGLGTAVGLLAWVLAGLLLLGVLVGPAWLVLPATLTHVARTDDVEAAFEVGRLCRIILRREYLLPWSAGAILLLAGSVAYGVVGDMAALGGGVIVAAGAVPGVDGGLVGHTLGAAANFYCQVTAFHLFGRGYAAADAVESARPAEQPTTSPHDSRDAGWGAKAREWRDRRREERRRA